MRTKLKLNLDQLTVDSFDTTRPAAKGGTVFGEQCTCYTQCTCPGCPTCDASCNGTCAASCNGSCDATCGCDTIDHTCDVYMCDPVSMAKPWICEPNTGGASCFC